MIFAICLQYTSNVRFTYVFFVRCLLYNTCMNNNFHNESYSYQRSHNYHIFVNIEGIPFKLGETVISETPFSRKAQGNYVFL